MVVFISSPQPRFLDFSDFNVVILVTFPQMNVCACARVCKIMKVILCKLLPHFFRELPQ